MKYSVEGLKDKHEEIQEEQKTEIENKGKKSGDHSMKSNIQIPEVVENREQRNKMEINKKMA